MYLLGIDIGTTNWKANLYDYRRKRVASASLPTATRQDRKGRHYYSPGELWSSVCRLTRQIIRQIKDPSQIKAVGFASMAEAGLLVDSRGKPLTDIIPWYDNRSIKEKEFLEKKLGRFEIFKTTGLNLTHIYSATKILWLSRHERAVFKEASKWLCVPDYLINKLTGEYATDYSIATRTAAFDMRKKAWAPCMLEALGVKESFFPKASVSGAVVGAVTGKACEESGLAAGTKICLGGQDHIVGAFGAGIFKPGDLLDSMGTAEVLLAVVKEPRRLKEIYNSGFSMGCYAVDGLYYIMAGIYCSGGLTEWFMNEFYGSSLTAAEKYARLAEDLKTAGKGERGVLALPYWLGRGAPLKDAGAKGALLGLTARTTRADILLAIYEGLSFEFRQLVEAMEKSTRIPVNTISLIGGGTKNKFWLEKKADIIGRKLLLPLISESVCFGAALLAGAGSGEIEAPQKITEAFKHELVIANLKKHRAYEELYRGRYKKIAALLSGFNN